MTVLDLSQKRIDGGFFALTSAERVPYSWGSKNGGSERFLGTYRDSGAPIRGALIDLLRNAKKRVFIASFVIGDTELIDEIVAAADRLRGGVYVICALDDLSLKRGLEEYDDDIDGSPEERRKNFERLTSRGVYVRGHESCHAKFALVDDKVAIIGSANFVTNGFVWTGEANVRIEGADEVGRLKQLFTALWYSGCTFEVPPGSNYLVSDRAPTESPLPYPAISRSRGAVVWTDGPDNTSLLDSIREVIDGAERTLVLSSYSVAGMVGRSDLLFDRIKAARDRGVETKFFVRQRNAWRNQRQELMYLYSIGVEIHGDTRNHAKVAIGDNRDAVLFSANFDATHGLDSGVEVGYRLSDSVQIGELSRYIEHAIAHADTRYVHEPLLSELDGLLAARWCEKWRYQRVLEVSGLDAVLPQYQTGALVPPVLYEECRNGAVRVWIGETQIAGRVKGDRVEDFAVEKAKNGDSNAKLEEWLASVRRKNDPEVKRRGIFAGKLMG